MKLTWHAEDRADERTRMANRDLLDLLAAGAVVPLGSKDNKEYLLFYSPRERRWKRAVVNPTRTKVISILHYFRRSQDFSWATHTQRALAKKLALAYFVARVVQNSVPHASSTKIKSPPAKYRAKIDIRVEGKSEYVYVHPELFTVKQGLSRQSALRATRESFMKLEQLIQQHRAKFIGRVSYCIYIYREHRTGVCKHFVYSQEQVRTSLNSRQ